MNVTMPEDVNFALISFIVVQVVGFATLYLKSSFDSKKAEQELEKIAILREQDRLDREQDLRDREQLAKLTKHEMEAIRVSGNHRLKVIVDEVREVRSVAENAVKVNEKALETANNFNEKIANLAEAVTKDKQETQKVEVTNTPLVTKEQKDPS